MKRDMNLIRLLLLEVESGEKPEAMDQYEEAQVLYHCELAIEAGLLEGAVVRGGQGDVLSATLQKLTWEGHEFLDAARDERIWKQVQKKVTQTGGAWTLEGLKYLLASFVKDRFL